MRLSNFLLHIGFALSLTALSAVLTYLMARHVRIMDVPNQRSMHTTATPKSGGVAIVVTFLIGSMAIYRIATVARIDHFHFWTFLAGGIVLAAVSFIDDIRQSSFLAKLSAQAIVSLAIVFAGLFITKLNIPFVGIFDLGFIGYVVTFLWLVGLTNAYNFMDGMDGLAGGVGLIAAGFLCSIAFHQNSAYVYLTAYVLAAGLAGFLIFNWPPAKIFMGDVGSAFVGYTFAVLALLGAVFDRGHLSFYVIPLLLFQFIFDTFFTFFRRAYAGEMVFMPHRTHLYQLLPSLGHSQRQVVTFHYVMAFAQGVGAWVLILLPQEFRPAVFLPYLFFNACYAIRVVGMAKRQLLI